jgi:transcriptional regulator with XRE-family HTH domain
MKFGEKLKILRVLEAYTQSQLAYITGLQQSSITRYEKGDTIPYSSPLSRLAEALKQVDNIKWLQGNGSYDWEGLIVFRPMSPVSEYTSLMIRSIDNALVELLPAFIADVGLNPKDIFTSQYGSLFIATDDAMTKSIAIVCRPEITDALCVAFPKIDKSYKISDVEILNILFYENTNTILKYTGLLGCAEQSYLCNTEDVKKQVETKENIIINMIGCSISEEELFDLKSYAKNWINKEGFDVNITIEIRNNSPSIEKHLDPKIWNRASKNYRFNEDNSAIVPV